MIKRPNEISAPAIHVSLLGAEIDKDGNGQADSGSGFTNLVYEPFNNGGVEVGKHYTLDAFTGKWWSTQPTVSHPRGKTDTLASFIDHNPSAKIVAISVDNGGSSSDTVPVDDLAAGADNLVIGMGTDFERYDFGG